MRARNQVGWLEETKAGSWKAHWCEYVRDPETGEEERRHHSRIVGDARKMRKFEAKEALGKIVAPLNATQSTRRDDRVPLRWFVEHRWQPKVKGNWGATTKKTNQYFVSAILTEFGDTPLRELDCVDLQSWLTAWRRPTRARWSSIATLTCGRSVKKLWNKIFWRRIRRAN